MSTIDPTIARKRRQDRRPSTVLVFLVLALLLVGGFALGFGWGSFGAFDESIDPPLLTISAILLGMPLTIICLILWAGIAMKPGDVGIGYGAAVSLFGAGAGVLTATRAMKEPFVATLVGYGILALGVLCVIAGVSAAAARRRQDAFAREIMQGGRLTTATVTDKGYVFFRESTKILTTVTFTFVDLNSVQRWVQRPLLIRAESPVVDGMETRLWYDPTDPGNDRKILVELALTHRFSNPVTTTANVPGLTPPPT